MVKVVKIKAFLKRTTVFILATLMLCSGLAADGGAQVMAASASNIIKSVSKNFTGFKTIKGNKYYFSKGKYVTGLKTIKGNKYYFSKSGKMLKNAFKQVGKHKYYFTSSGKAKVGILNLNTQKHKNKRYYFNSKGQMQTGLVTYKGVKYYFAPKGKKFTGFVKVNGKTYYVKSDGKVQKGFATINGKRYYFTSSGVMVTGWKVISSKYYYFNSKGVMQKGFVKINGYQYYFDSSTGVMKTGLVDVNGSLYYIERDGIIFYPTAKKGWEETESGDRYFYTANGYLLKNMVCKINGSYYGFDANGKMYRGYTKIGDYTYYFNEETGAAYTGWQGINNFKYYFDSKGHMAFGYKIIKKHLYYFEDSGVLYNKGTIEIAGKTYSQRSDGAILNCWFNWAGDVYYFDETGLMATGVKAIDGIKYYFNSDGTLYDDNVKRKGIDVSKWQGEIDWKKVKDDGIEFAMIRIGYEYTLDSYFKKNIEGAKAAGIAVGVYIYSYAESVSEAKKEAEFVIKNLKGYQLEYPVAFDIEDKVQSVLTNKQRTDIVEAFCNKMNDAGYYTCVYASKSWFENNFDSRIEKYDKWVAQWPENNKPINDTKKTCSYKGKYGMWQFTSSGSVKGISGRVDLNYSYTNYPALIKKMGYNNW